MKIKNIKVIGLLTILTVFSLGSCNDDFLEEKKDYTGVNEDVFKEPLLAQAYVDYIYGLFLPGDNAASITWELAAGGNDDFAQTTEELGGEVNWNKPWATIAANQAHCLPYIGSRMNSSVGNNTWTRLRQINLFLNEVDKYGMDEPTRNKLKGQLYFWRAWQYFDMVKLYGGVPLVLKDQNPILDDAKSTEIKRSSTSDCIEQIVADLDKAKLLLKDVVWTAADHGRINEGAAAAFKGRVLLTWASPLFNRTDDTARWQRAYDANSEAKTILEAKGKGLEADWGAMWTKEGSANKEAIIIYGFNVLDTQNLQKNNGSEKACRPKAIGGGGLSPTAQMVESFPMIDGKDISSSSTAYPYNPKRFYKNRDPRFAKTFAFNGAKWAYQENANYKTWTYSWYTSVPGATTNPQKFTEGGNNNATGIYLNKATSSSASYSNNLFGQSGTDYLEMRFAEVVLNLAESAIGINKLSEGKTLIESVRKRAGIVIGDGNYGLSTVTTRDQHFAAVLKERKVEFAYENKRFADLRRWMLFDDTYGTITRLGGAAAGFKPLSGSRRTGYFIVAKKNDGTPYVNATVDPFLPNVLGVAPIVNRDPTFPYTIPATGISPGTVIANEAAYLDYLYDNYFDVKVKDNVESSTAGWKFNWYNEYYFFGIYQNLLDTAPYLEQTQGWGGTFDPTK